MFSSVKEILKLAIPAMGEMILYMLIWVFDTAMVGNYSGDIGVSSVGVSGEVLYTFSNIFLVMGVAVAVNSLVSRALGGNDKDLAEKYIKIGIKYGTFVTIIITLFFFIFGKQLLTLMGAKDAVLESGYNYFKIATFGIFFNMIIGLLNGVFRACKDSKTPLKVAMIINSVNILLDYVLIYGKFGFPQLGVQGAAIASVTGTLLGFIYLMFRLKKLPFNLTIKNVFFCKSQLKEDLVTLFSLAIPSSLQEASFSIARLINVALIMSLGSIQFSANQITVAIESMSFMPGWGVAVAATTLAGHGYGARDAKKTKEYSIYSTVIAAIFMGSIGTLFYLIPEFFINLFLKESSSEIIALGIRCLKIVAFSQIPVAIAMVLEGALKGMGDTKTPFYTVLFCNWCIRLPLVYYFVFLKGMGVLVYWKIVVLHWSVEAAIILILSIRKWRNLEAYFKLEKE